MAYIELSIATLAVTKNATNARALRIVEGAAKYFDLLATEEDLAAMSAAEQEAILSGVNNKIAQYLVDAAKAYESREAVAAARQSAIEGAEDWIE